MAKIKKHYNIDSIDKLGASINTIFGKRANGKSYQVKHKKAVIPYLNGCVNYVDRYTNKGDIITESIESGSEFMLVRRWREEISPTLIERYFDDVDVERLTDGKYNIISVYRGEIFLSNWDQEKSRIIKGAKIGYVVALSTEQKYAGGSYLKVRNINVAFRLYWKK